MMSTEQRNHSKSQSSGQPARGSDPDSTVIFFFFFQSQDSDEEKANEILEM